MAVRWTADPLRMSYIFQFAGKLILPAQKIGPGIIANISTVILQQEATLKGVMDSLLTYAWVFEDEWVVRFFMRLVVIVDDMMSLNVPADDCRGDLMCYSRDGGIIFKHSRISSPSFHTAIDMKEARTLRITRSDDSTLSISSQKYFLYIN